MIESRYSRRMTLPRSLLIDANVTPYYHCVSRCVRRAFLCGKDSRTGYNFEHRRAWIERRLQKLAGIFAIDLCAYAVMSNHYHVVLHVNQRQLGSWDDDEVVTRYSRLHRVPEDFELARPDDAARIILRWRKRLGSISWFMKCINEPLARSANKEDDCKGRFWEGRFKSQALLDTKAVLKCMAYVDLNPIRAGKAVTPAGSRYTSIHARIKGHNKALAPMAEASDAHFKLLIPFPEYLQLVNYTGCHLRRGKRGRITAGQPVALERLEQSHRDEWLDDMANLTRRYCRAIGSAASLRIYRDCLGQMRLNGVSG